VCVLLQVLCTLQGTESKLSIVGVGGKMQELAAASGASVHQTIHVSTRFVLLTDEAVPADYDLLPASQPCCTVCAGNMDAHVVLTTAVGSNEGTCTYTVP